MIQNEIFQFRTLLNEAQKILIALSSDCDEDEMAGALALYLLLTKKGKQADIVSAKKIKVEEAYLYAIDKIKNSLAGSNNLVVSLPYKEGTIEKVSYNIENDRFNLVIEPRGEGLSLNPNEIDYQFGRGDFDLAVVVGADELTNLGEIYKRIQRQLKEKPIVNIDKSTANTRFGRINLLNDASVSRAVTLVVKFLNLPLDSEAASNLLTGLTLSLKSFDLESAKPEDLEAVAYLLRSGGKNLRKKEKKEKIMEEKPRRTVDFFEEKKVQTVEPAPEEWLRPKILTTKKTSDLI